MAKFKVGDKVVMIGGSSMFSGRPKVREIENVSLDPRGLIRYSGGGIVLDGETLYTWFCSEDKLILESEFQWPSEFEMRLADKRAQEHFQRSLESIASHEDGSNEQS